MRVVYTTLFIIPVSGGCLAFAQRNAVQGKRILDQAQETYSREFQS